MNEQEPQDQEDRNREKIERTLAAMQKCNEEMSNDIAGWELPPEWQPPTKKPNFWQRIITKVKGKK